MRLLRQMSNTGGILLLSNNRNAFALYDWLKIYGEQIL